MTWPERLILARGLLLVTLPAWGPFVAYYVYGRVRSRRVGRGFEVLPRTGRGE